MNSAHLLKSLASGCIQCGVTLHCGRHLGSTRAPKRQLASIDSPAKFRDLDDAFLVVREVQDADALSREPCLSYDEKRLGHTGLQELIVCS
jgi:hypothetical protein